MKREYGIQVENSELIIKDSKFDVCIAAVSHKQFEELDILSLLNEKHVIYDVKCMLDRNIVDGRL